MNTYQDVLRDTVKFYHVNPRGVDRNGRCRYLTEDGKMCSVGRVLDPHHPQYEEITKRIMMSVSALIKNYSMDIFLPEYRHLNDLTFWNQLQDLHDEDMNWVKMTGGNVLSERGWNKYHELMNTLNENDWDESQNLYDEYEDNVPEHTLEDLQEAIVESGGRFFRREELRRMSLGDVLGLVIPNGIRFKISYDPKLVEK